MKKRLIDLGIMLLTTFIMLLICEFIFGWVQPQQLAPMKFRVHPEMGLRHIPGLEGLEHYPNVYDFTFKNGEDGFRATHKGESPKNVNKKIMLLGDSFTYGKGVSNHETFAYKLQEGILKDSALINNAGVEGRGTDYCLRAYQFYKDKYQPNSVIYFAHYNDLADNIREDYFKIENDSILTPNTFEKETGGIKDKLGRNKLYNWLASHSHLFVALKNLMFNVLGGGGEVIRYEDGIDKDKAKRLTKTFLLQLKKEVEADGRKFFVYYIPANHDMTARAGNSVTWQESYFIELCTENNVTFHNFSEDLLNSGTDRNEIVKHFYLEEGHWNKNGHQLVSEQLKKDAYGFY